MNRGFVRDGNSWLRIEEEEAGVLFSLFLSFSGRSSFLLSSLDQVMYILVLSGKQHRLLTLHATPLFESRPLFLFSFRLHCHRQLCFLSSDASFIAKSVRVFFKREKRRECRQREPGREEERDGFYIPREKDYQSLLSLSEVLGGISLTSFVSIVPLSKWHLRRKKKVERFKDRKNTRGGRAC